MTKKAPETTSEHHGSVGKRLKDARKAVGISQAELAKMCDLTQSAVSDIEREKSSTSIFLPQIANALGVSAIWLATGKGSHEPIEVAKDINEALQAAWDDVDEAIKAILKASPAKMTEASEKLLIARNRFSLQLAKGEFG
ncbi:helix-turn-helix domain-containing protein [Pseudomonas aeruginosa]